MQIKELKDDISDIQAVLAVQFPFIASLGSRCKIVASENLQFPAGVTKENYLIINPKEWETFDLRDRVFIFAHEVCHIAFQHLDRRGNREPKIWNYATDAVINDILEDVLSHNVKCISLRGLSYDLSENYDSLSKSSAEEIHDRMARKAVTYRFLSSQYGDADDLTGIPSPEGSSTIQEGDEEINNSTNGEAKEKLWSEAVAQAYSMQKSIGTVPEGLARLVDQLLKAKVRWENILKKEIAVGIGKNIIGDWRKRSRKLPAMFPGLRKETLPTIWNLVDTSGSIDEKELRQFISEIYAQARETSVKVIPFDARSYEIIQANTQSDVIREVSKRLKGGGGTEIRDALEKTFKQMQYGDIVVILTDGDIYDKESPEVLDLARRIKYKASASVVVFTHSEVPFWKNVKMEI